MTEQELYNLADQKVGEWATSRGFEYIPDGCAMISFNKSGVASRTGFVLGACVVDSGYTGEIIGNMLNTSNDVRKISFGQKLFQSVIIPVLFPAVEEVDAETYSNLHHEGDRGTGGFGSTGK